MSHSDSNRKLQRLARERAKETGENYTAALAQVEEEHRRAAGVAVGGDAVGAAQAAPDALAGDPRKTGDAAAAPADGPEPGAEEPIVGDGLPQGADRLDQPGVDITDEGRRAPCNAMGAQAADVPGQYPEASERQRPAATDPEAVPGTDPTAVPPAIHDADPFLETLASVRRTAQDPAARVYFELDGRVFSQEPCPVCVRAQARDDVTLRCWCVEGPHEEPLKHVPLHVALEERGCHREAAILHPGPSLGGATRRVQGLLRDLADRVIFAGASTALSPSEMGSCAEVAQSLIDASGMICTHLVAYLGGRWRWDLAMMGSIVPPGRIREAEEAVASLVAATDGVRPADVVRHLDEASAGLFGGLSFIVKGKGGHAEAPVLLAIRVISDIRRKVVQGVFGDALVRSGEMTAMFTPGTGNPIKVPNMDAVRVSLAEAVQGLAVLGMPASDAALGRWCPVRGTDAEDAQDQSGHGLASGMTITPDVPVMDLPFESPSGLAWGDGGDPDPLGDVVVMVRVDGDVCGTIRSRRESLYSFSTIEQALRIAKVREKVDGCEIPWPDLIQLTESAFTMDLRTLPPRPRVDPAVDASAAPSP